MTAHQSLASAKTIRRKLARIITHPAPEGMKPRSKLYAALIERNKTEVGEMLMKFGLGDTPPTASPLGAAQRLQASLEKARSRKDLFHIGHSYGFNLSVFAAVQRRLIASDDSIS